MTEKVALVVGFGVSGEAVTRPLRRLGFDVVACDDRPSDDTRRRAAAAGVALVEHPDAATLDELVRGASVVVPSPGVPAHHPAIGFARAAGVALESEIGLAADAIDVPLVAVTGTNGKTTVTTLTEQMLRASGLRTVAAGNIGTPLTSAVGESLDVVVVEVSSFQLELAPRFRPDVGVWLNFAPDHLDWHGTNEHYAAAKFRVWANQRPDDVAVANADDPVVDEWSGKAPARVVCFSTENPADFGLRDGDLEGPGGERIVRRDELWRSLPHDVSNALAASAASLSAGATLEGVRAALREFRGLPHRVWLVGDAAGVRWYDDSKATNPHAALAAIRSFASVVLVAGGQNKGLDLSALSAAADHVRAVVAIGSAADEVSGAFEGLVPVVRAASMDDAVVAAAGVARPGDVVLLAPGCASFDWYGSYAERGDDFARAVAEVTGA